MKLSALAAAAFLCLTAPRAAAADIAIALTDERIAVDTGFSGARLTLFGAVSGVENPAQAVDLIAVIRGPTSQFQIRQLEKRGLIWTPGAGRVISAAPGLYLTASTRAVTDIAPLPDQAAYRLTADFLDLVVADDGEAIAQPAQDQLYKNAFLTEIEEQELYRDSVGDVDFKKGGLFAVNVALPANTPVGEYSIAVFLYRDGVLLGRDAAALTVNKVGVERRIFELAHARPVSYGIICVAMSLLAGWIAALAFRK